MSLINLNMLTMPAQAAFVQPSLPIGSLTAYLGEDVPADWLVCDGSSVLRADYPQLFARLGTAYGAVDDTHFNLPDLRGRFLEGADNAGVMKEPGLPNIKGTYGGVDSGCSGAIYVHKQQNSLNNYSVINNRGIGFDASKYNPIYSNDVTTVQPASLTVRWLIKASTTMDRWFTIIYPNGGDVEHPANVTVNQRYVMQNPFPGWYVTCQTELLYNNVWGSSGEWIYADGGGYGITAFQYGNDEIVIQTGSYSLLASSHHDGNSFALDSTNFPGVIPLPCRVKVWKVGKIDEEV